VVSSRALFGSCLYILEEVLRRYGVEVTFVDGRNLDEWRAAVRPGTKAVFFETVSNPTLEVIDVRAVSEIAHAVGALVIADNVFATPVYSRAVELGADVVVYSTTKHVDGQGRALGGIVLGTKQYIRKVLEPYMKHTGGAMSPFTSWLMLKGLETMDLRVRAQAATALMLAEALEGHPALSRVIYPGLVSHPQHDVAMAQTGSGGTVLSFDLGSREAAFRFLNALEIAIISNNLGDAKSIVTHPASTTHQRLAQAQKDLLGITPGLVRFSCGIEDPEDLVADLLGALDAAQGSQPAQDAAE
jgi:O-succinylhomoserine sulfhydrylase